MSSNEPITKELQILSLGASADGIAEGSDGASIFVSKTLPGETVIAAVSDNRANLRDILSPSPDRIEPICQHFGECGGCAAQHMAPKLYASWKRACITTALAKKGIQIDVADMYSVGLGARRKVVLSVDPRKATSTNSNQITSGFHKEYSTDVINLAQCPVIAPDIIELLPRLRTWIAPLAAKAPNLRINVLSAKNGIDINISNTPPKLPRALIAKLSSTAAMLGAIRVMCERDPLYEATKPIIDCGPANVIPHPGAFLQAAREAEQHMVKLITQAIPKRAKHVADLFCGLGAFAFPLALKTQVSAFDSDASAIEALNHGIRHTQSIKKVTAKVRDLFQEPLSRRELDEFDALVFDPPRAGAKTQAHNVAKSKIPVVVAVSCNPATFARDARSMIDGGYVLQSVTPIDQFVYAAHIELVAVFHK